MLFPFLSAMLKYLCKYIASRHIAELCYSAALHICDPPQENREKGERTVTHAMTRHAKRVTNPKICAYLIRKTKSVTLVIVPHAKAFVRSSVPFDTLSMQYGTRAKSHACVGSSSRVIRHAFQNRQSSVT